MAKDFCEEIRKTARLTTNLYEYHFRKSDFKLRYTQFYLLRYLKGSNHTGLGDIARELEFKSSTLVRNISTMVKKGLISRSNNENDWRKSKYKLTKNGLEAVESLENNFKEAQLDISEKSRFGFEHGRFLRMCKSVCDEISRKLGIYAQGE
jgi:DNA-binding MarR family transcriptional regulator